MRAGRSRPGRGSDRTGGRHSRVPAAQRGHRVGRPQGEFPPTPTRRVSGSRFAGSSGWVRGFDPVIRKHMPWSGVTPVVALDPASTLSTGLVLAVACGLYGWLVAFLWAPFLVAERFRVLFASLPPDGAAVNYGLWMPLPAALWGFLAGSVFSLSAGGTPSTASAAVDGIVAATLVSVLLWPTVLLYVLPAGGVDWTPTGRTLPTVALVVGGTAWYLLFLVVPASVATVFAGFGEAMSG